MQNAKGETIWFAITKGGKLQPEAMFAYSNGPEHFAALAVLHGEANPAEVKQQVEAYIRKVMASYYPEN
jgi:hypothetical protein